ncbi:multidrug efflux RND transporter permease subunit [Vulcanimicrobium alpinum]|uniref:Multidrug efflux RND transporter permease subunit n=1 Tax=Vulcanimicrobium alpinum TaxID=3016050 RepID=A0AAN2CAG9_UNVUL|nr:efflux RND transporter permease subunit [Vulcanimicrobium alpinum]BDE06642.1 multidrug efflux RND transporter permease subunit [Vulcanimicrobium alpinum]
MIDFFLHRPVFASVCALFIILAGLISIPTLPVAQFPQVAPPVVTVSSTYIGANAQAAESSVTTPLEEAVNGVDGLRYISSTTTNDGTSTIVCTFFLDRNIDAAANDLQNQVDNTIGRLPAEVRATGVTVTKNNGSFVLGMGLGSRDPRYDRIFLSNYASLTIVDVLKRVRGVNDVRIFGERRYAMRLWLDPTRLNLSRVTAGDVVSALQTQNVQIAAGAIGAAPIRSDQPYQVSIRALGRLHSGDDFGNLILRSNPDGGFVRLRDVGRVELGAESYAQDLRLLGADAVGIGILTLPSANALQVERDVLAAMQRLSARFPHGVYYKTGFDAAPFVADSIGEVLKTLLISVVLVVIVVFLFLRNWRTTLVPAITIPVSLIGTFALMKALGFSINTLTLFGITLATGLVVDDAIVVIENIARFIHDKGMPPLAGAAAAMKEITGAVVASSLVLLAVFVPVAFFAGTTGQLYKQFALTIACSITISLFSALTLTPALSALLIEREERRHGAFFRAVNRLLAATRSGYHAIVPRLLRMRAVVLALFALGLAATYFAYAAIPTGFLPDEDVGYFYITVQLPEGASLAQTERVTRRIEGILAGIPEIAVTFEPNGTQFGTNASNRAMMFVSLKPWAERKGAGKSADGIMRRVRPQLGAIADATVLAFNPPTIRGIGNLAGFQFELQDAANAGIPALTGAARGLIANARRDPVLRNVSTTFRDDAPQLVVEIDRAKVASLGIPIADVFAAMQVYLGSQHVNDFDFLNRSFRVYVQADTKFRDRLNALDRIYVRANGAAPQLAATIPLGSLVRTHVARTAPIITHYNLLRSIEINGIPAPGYGSGQALGTMTALASTIPAGMAYEWTGISLEQIEFGSQALVIFGLGLLCVFLVLAANYENYWDPAIILVSVPLAILGAILALDARGLPSDLYAQVGYLMLIALASKNAILIVEFANQRRRAGLGAAEAVAEAAQTRLRPILMTSLAFILATVPLVVASGAGAASRISLGTAVFGGMILSTVLNLFVVPVVYVALAALRDRLARRSRAPAAAVSGHAPGAVPVSMVRTADGELLLHFADGSEPVRLSLPEP